jgi:SRSO17 transposase
MAAVTAPERTAAQHQSLLHFIGPCVVGHAGVGQGGEVVLSRIERHGPITACIVDDTGFPKKGRHPVGVAWQNRFP